MRQLVLDASVALSWLLPDEQSDSTAAVQAELLKAGALWVAAHWSLEVANSLCMAERKKRLDAAGVAQAVSLYTQIPVTVDPETNDHASAETLSLARQHTLRSYDSICTHAGRRGFLRDSPPRSPRAR